MNQLDWSGVESTGLDSPLGVHFGILSPEILLEVDWTPVDSSCDKVIGLAVIKCDKGCDCTFIFVCIWGHNMT